jgi:hypothetical protein
VGGYRYLMNLEYKSRPSCSARCRRALQYCGSGYGLFSRGPRLRLLMRPGHLNVTRHARACEAFRFDAESCANSMIAASHNEGTREHLGLPRYLLGTPIR